MAGTYSVEKLNSASKSFARFSNCCFIMLRYLSAMLSMPVSDVIPIKTSRQSGHWKKHIGQDIHINSDIRSLTLSLNWSFMAQSILLRSCPAGQLTYFILFLGPVVQS